MVNKQKDLIGSIRKAIQIIETFSIDDTLQSIQELSEKTGYAKTTVHRILQTLVHEGWIIQDVYSKRYGIGYGLLGYDKLVILQESLITVCDPIMRKLRQELNETVILAVIERKNYVRCIHKIESEQHIKLISKVGRTMPLYAGATARCILAFQGKDNIASYLKDKKLDRFTVNTIIDIDILKIELNKISIQGYAVSESEIDMDTFTVAAPIFTKGNCILGSISVSCPKYRYSADKEKHTIEWVIKASQDITSNIRGNI